MSYAELDGVVLRYRTRGQGPPLLLIRGLARSMDYWLDLEPRLAERFTTIAFDNRGVGGSDVPRPPYSTSMLADDAAHLLRFLDIPSAHVFGISLGGMVAQMLAIRHPHRVRRLALGAAHPGPPHAPFVSASAASRLALMTVLPQRVGQRLGFEMAVSPTAAHEQPELRRRWSALARRWPVSRRGFVGQLVAAALHRPGAALEQIRHPTLIIHGSADRIVPLSSSLALKELLPDARLRVIPGAGHDFPDEQTERTAELLTEFFLEDQAS